ncbi:MAG: type II secretion system protein GspD, partial [Hellea sp.]|nr:type II secretion system protein GspD [Hellea sp.]
GLLQDDEQIDFSKVPLLGDLPIVGRAFQSKGKSRKKTNLMVFLRPKIIRSASDARPLTQELLNRARREDMLQSQRLTSKIDDYLSDTEQPALSNDK